MEPREPAGCECGEGKSAELFTQAWMKGGAVGNTRGTVCGEEDAAGALSAYRKLHVFRVKGLSVGACLYRLFILKPENEKYGGHST